MKIENECSEFEKDITEITQEMVSLLTRKRIDYGLSFEGIWDKYGAITCVIRLEDKIARLGNLIKNQIKPKNESIIDTFRDIIGYGILALRKMKINEQKQPEL